MSNSNSIHNRYDSVAYQLSEQKRAQRWGEERIALAHHANRKSHLSKDIVLPAAPEKGGKKVSKGKQGAQKPSLPASKKSWDGLNKGQDLSVVFLLGRIMSLEAKKNTDYWVNLWKMGSLNMKMGLKLGGILGTVAENKWEEQAAALLAEKDMAFHDAFAYLAGFGGSTFEGGRQAYQDYKTKNKGKDPTGFQKQSDNSTNQSPTARGSDESSARAGQTLNENNLSKTDKAKRTAKSMGKKAKKAILTMNKFFEHAGKAAENSKGMTMLFIRVNDTHYKGLAAYHQGQAGIANALEQTVQQFAKYHTQSIAKSEEVRAGVAQNIMKSMNILRAITDQVSSSVSSMFFG